LLQQLPLRPFSCHRRPHQTHARTLQRRQANLK
jgi:hypothetical protein